MSLTATFQTAVEQIFTNLGDLAGEGVVKHKLRGTIDADTLSSNKMKELHTVDAVVVSKEALIKAGGDVSNSGFDLSIGKKLIALIKPPATVTAGDEFEFGGKNYPISEVEEIKPAATVLLYIATLKQ